MISERDDNENQLEGFPRTAGGEDQAQSYRNVGTSAFSNRSYCEEVLVCRMHPEILRSQELPEELRDEKSIWEDRYRSIRDLEDGLPNMVPGDGCSSLMCL